MTLAVITSLLPARARIRPVVARDHIQGRMQALPIAAVIDGADVLIVTVDERPAAADPRTQ